MLNYLQNLTPLPPFIWVSNSYMNFSHANHVYVSETNIMHFIPAAWKLSKWIQWSMHMVSAVITLLHKNNLNVYLFSKIQTPPSNSHILKHHLETHSFYTLTEPPQNHPLSLGDLRPPSWSSWFQQECDQISSDALTSWQHPWKTDGFVFWEFKVFRIWWCVRVPMFKWHDETLKYHELFT